MALGYGVVSGIATGVRAVLGSTMLVTLNNLTAVSVQNVERMSIAGTAFGDTLWGGALGDTLSGGSGGDDDLRGGGGDDVIEVRGGGTFDARGGTGNDRFVISAPFATVGFLIDVNGDMTFATGPLAGSATGFEMLTVTTGSGADRITGGAFDDDITTFSGDDTVFGGAGDDRLILGDGSNGGSGGAGDDTIAASAQTGETSRFWGGAGDDSLFGARLSDGGAGNDTITSAGAAGETVNGGDGSDLI